MSPRQILLRGSERASAEIDLVENEDGAPPISFEDVSRGVRVPRYGGGALLNTAANAIEHGYQVRRFELVGADRAPIANSDYEYDISNELVEALERSGARGAQGLLRRSYASYLICGVQLYSEKTRVVTLRRNGVVVGADETKLWAFIHDVLEDEDTAS